MFRLAKYLAVLWATTYAAPPTDISCDCFDLAKSHVEPPLLHPLMTHSNDICVSSKCTIALDEVQADYKAAGFRPVCVTAHVDFLPFPVDYCAIWDTVDECQEITANGLTVTMCTCDSGDYCERPTSPVSVRGSLPTVEELQAEGEAPTTTPTTTTTTTATTTTPTTTTTTTTPTTTTTTTTTPTTTTRSTTTTTSSVAVTATEDAATEVAATATTMKPLEVEMQERCAVVVDKSGTLQEGEIDVRWSRKIVRAIMRHRNRPLRKQKKEAEDRVRARFDRQVCRFCFRAKFQADFKSRKKEPNVRQAWKEGVKMETC